MGWQSPAAMFIEAAATSFHQADLIMLDSQQKELTAFGDERVRELGVKGLNNDFRMGYALGLQTARMIMAGSPALRLKGVNPGEVL